MVNFQSKKLVQGSANNSLIEDPIEGSNGTAVVFRVNDFIQTVEDTLNSSMGGQVTRSTYTSPTVTAPLTSYIIAYVDRSVDSTLTLPKADVAGSGKQYFIIDESDQAATHTITVLMPPLSGPNDTYIINTNGGILKVYSTGVKWVVV